MHFSIPDTQEFMENTGSVYVGYNIHINGIFHCTVRYKQLLNLHEQLEKDLDVTLPPFPPKKFFPLTSNQQEERRLTLEKYIQTIGQNAIINRSELLNGFLLNAQVETAGYSLAYKDLEIFLLNGRKFTFSVSIGEHSGVLLKKICRLIKLPEKYDSFFTLLVMVYDANGDVNIFRKLQDFESPVLTMRNIQREDTRVVLAKWYWDTEYDIETTNNPVARNLLYIQTAAEIERGWILVPQNLMGELKELRDNDEERKYLDIARTLKYYGCVHFIPCFCDYPVPRTVARVAIGRNEMNLRIAPPGEEEKELSFKVTHMRCWRITTVHNGIDKYEDVAECSLELSFEYLMAKNTLVWITLTSDQAILMSVCIQSMIDELLLKNAVGSRNQDSPSKPWTYIMRDGHSRILIGSPSPEHSRKHHKDEEVGQKSNPIIKRITDRLSATYLRKLNRSSSEDGYCFIGHDTRENRAFGVIGDDDL